MNPQIPEIVDLPDPAVRPLVHPLDVPPARRLFRAATVVGALTGPYAGLGLAALVWFASASLAAAAGRRRSAGRPRRAGPAVPDRAGVGLHPAPAAGPRPACR